MTYSQVLKITGATSLSPEQLAPYLGVSNMTIRRWSGRASSRQVSKAHARAISDGVTRLITDGHLDASRPVVREFLEKAGGAFTPALEGLGVSAARLEDVRGQSGDHSRKVANLLRDIGSSELRCAEVDAADDRLRFFKALGRDWKQLIEQMISVIRSDSRRTVEKTVAYGALFYVIYPFDLVPDQLPVLGLADDFAILTMAASFYAGSAARRKKRDATRD